MSQKNDFVPGSGYYEAQKEIARITALEVMLEGHGSVSERYAAVKERWLQEIDIQTACYYCLQRVKGKSLIYPLAVDEGCVRLYFFHEPCFDKLIAGYFSVPEKKP